MDDEYMSESSYDEEPDFDTEEPDEPGGPGEPEEGEPNTPAQAAPQASPTALTFTEADSEADGYFPPGTILEEEQPPCVKFEIDRAIEKGIDLQPFAGLTDMQLRQMRLAYENGVGGQLAAFVKHGDDPNPFNHIQMEIIRIGLEQGLDVTVYAQERFNANQMWQLYLAEQEGLPAERLAVVDPKRYPKFHGDYTDEQMKELRLALEENMDLHKIDNPEFTADAMHEKRRSVSNARVQSPVRAAMAAYKRAKQRRKLERLQKRERTRTPDEGGGSNS